VVAPDSAYMEHFDISNSIKYIPGDIESATTCIKDALDAKKEPFYSLRIYRRLESCSKKYLVSQSMLRVNKVY
jgi:hypothetical protein